MTEQQSDKRRAARLHHDVLVAYRSDSGVSASGFALDVSRVGLFLNAEHLLPVGALLKMIVSIPGMGAPFELQGRVVRCIGRDEVKQTGRGAPGMGVEFLDVDEAAQARIEEIVQTLTGELPGINEV